MRRPRRGARIKRWIWGALVLAGPLYTESVAADQQEVERFITAAEEAFLDVEYEEALEVLEQAEAASGATERQLAQLFALRGTILFLQGQTESARTAFDRLLALDASHELPDAYPPRVAAFLDQIRAERLRSSEIDHIPPQGFQAGESLELTAEIRNVTDAHSVRLYFRSSGGDRYSSVEMVRVSGDSFMGTIPGSAAVGAMESGLVEYFILVALGEERIANVGTPRHPLSFPIVGEEQESPRNGDEGGGSIASRWWFWLALGGAVAILAGFGVGLWFILADSNSVGTVNVTLRFQDP